MATRISKEVTDRMRECRFVLSAFQTEANLVAETLAGLTQPNLEETDEAPGFASVLVGLRRNVNASLEKLMAADAKLTSAVGWESALRKEQREKGEAQGLALIALRRAVIAQYVDPDLENLSLQPVEVRDPVTVARRSKAVSERFEAPNLARMLGQPRFAAPVALEPLLAEVRGTAEELLALGERVNEAERRTARARAEKKTLQEEHDKQLLRSSRVLEDFCRLAGDEELAEKIRRAIRSGTPGPEPGEDEPGEDEPGEDEPGDVNDPIEDFTGEEVTPFIDSSPEGEEPLREI